MKSRILRDVSSAIAMLALTVATPIFAQTTVFTKTLDKVNGVPVTGTPSSLTNGDTLDWVLTYQYNPIPAPPAKTDIRDLLSPALQYVPNSLVVPQSFAPQWFNGSAWVATQPATATGVGATANPTPFGAGVTASIPAPPSSAIATASGGDGYRAIPYNGDVYVINHHVSGLYLNCFNAATGAACNGYPANVPLTPGPFLTTLGTPTHHTPYKTVEYLNRTNGKLYYAVQDLNTAKIGILCANLNTRQSCGFTSLPGSYGAANTQSFEGVGGVNGEVYIQLPSGELGCVDTNPAVPILCPGQPFPMATVNLLQMSGGSEIVGTKIYTVWRTSGQYPFTCFDTATHQKCTGAWPQFPDTNGAVAILYPLIDPNTEAVTAICTHTTNPANGTFKCYDPAGALVPHPPSYATWANTYGGGFAEANGFGQPGWYKARVFNGKTGGTGVGCYDFLTNAPCATGFPVNGPHIAPEYYATIADPERPGCMWTYGDLPLAVLGSFQASDGKACGSASTVAATITPARSYCATAGNIQRWGSIFLNGITLGSGITATLTLYDGNNPTQLARDVSNNPYANNLPVTTFPISLATGGLGIGYGMLAGQYTSLRVVLQFSGFTSNAAWSQQPPPFIEVTWIGSRPEICFQTKVVGCENPTITNQATAVTTPFAGAPITNTAPNPPFSATHILGDACPAKLTVVKSLLGVPAGYTGTFNFNVTCATSSGIVQQTLSITWPNTTVTSANIPAGSTCTVSESPLLPTLPPGYSWNGVPVVSPAGGVIQVATGSINQVNFLNTARRCEDGQVKIRKVVQNAPAGFSGTFTFNVACWSGTTLIQHTATIAFPGQTTAVVNGIPAGSTCTVTETGTLPALPAGWFWEAPTYLPATGQVSLTAGVCCPIVTVINRAKYCCDERKPGYDPGVIDVPLPNAVQRQQ